MNRGKRKSYICPPNQSVIHPILLTDELLVGNYFLKAKFWSDHVPLLTCLAQPGGLFSIEEEIRSTKVKIVSPGPDQKYAKKEEERKFPSLSKKLVVRYQIGKHNTRRREGYATPIFRKSCVQSPSADHQLHCNTLQCSVQCCSWKTSRLGFSSSALTILSTKMQNFSGIACIPVICHFW